ncbi:hypothetical protein FJR45_03015 [Sulfurimonas sediminis]|uniref:Uncharacterized protein n=1 Tax=Sulfurimonas sediminis TaxID=2590020 RepID=A0A7M1B0A5_9BACT|nr:hypothetical protein [Sulfurimonas sediminis]QOP42976.1 hypothetical protein FJR45_03015 [Sulfurimonas sediminis]
MTITTMIQLSKEITSKTDKEILELIRQQVENLEVFKEWTTLITFEDFRVFLSNEITRGTTHKPRTLQKGTSKGLYVAMIRSDGNVNILLDDFEDEI